MEAVEMSELRVRRRILEVMDQVFPADTTWRDRLGGEVGPSDLRAGGLGAGERGTLDRGSCEGRIESGSASDGLFPETQRWRMPLFEVFKDAFESDFVDPHEFADLVGEWMVTQPRISDPVRVELFAMTLAWTEWTFAWSHRD